MSNSHYQNMLRTPGARLTPIACRVCDRVFFDNVSLVLHFECHLKDDVLTPGHLSLNLSCFSCPSVGRMNGGCHLVFPRMNNCSMPCPSPVSSSITSNVSPRDVTVHMPVLNSMPPINPSFDARGESSQSTHRSTMSSNRATSSLTHPLINSQLGARSFSRGLVPVPPLVLHEQTGGQGHLSDYKDPHIMQQFEKPTEEIILISDDEEDDKKDAIELDLTLKL
ncbi:hypothetical protein BUALT_Bualt12G0144600 [Buddleja alternifolia]|uniref:C2H2-type domain-containing protein n=1 Tax=Buddleja alternifolia TaxID=168488 RepID=A0AAV6WRV5_9LAMI|nr:hypothetical protein BUALT_Bualt12G0144600 [Buddleja alternifolia]